MRGSIVFAAAATLFAAGPRSREFEIDYTATVHIPASVTLRPDRLVPLDDRIREWANQVVNAANTRTGIEKAPAIYSHVVATVKYDKIGKGCGRGDIYYACDQRRGNCTDFHAIFIGYARAPSKSRRDSPSAGFPQTLRKPRRTPREYYFGAHDENRLEFTRGRDLVLTPRQHPAPLNFFIYPYAEADGQSPDGVEHALTYRDTPRVACR